MKKTLLIAALAMSAVAADAAVTTPLWMRNMRISPDGSTIAFTYQGDIYTVPAKGGMATRLTTVPSYETNPIWSPDGKKIAFNSDRHGGMDVFVMDAQGGAPTRLTFNSANETLEAWSPDGKEVYYSAAIQDPATSAMFPTGRMTELYRTAADGKGTFTQVLGTPAKMISFDKDGKSFVYQDIKGHEDTWRKHHTSSVTRDIWRYDASTGRHTNLTKRGGEDLNPVLASDGTVYFLSERNGGTMNVYSAPVTDMSNPKAVTSFKTHPVRFLSRSTDGTLCFGYDGEIYTMVPGDKPRKVSITLIADNPETQIDKLNVRSGASEFSPSPDGKSIAFVYRGDVYVTSTEYATTKQVTNTPEAERGVVWTPDGKKLIYVSERDGAYNLYEASMARPDDDANWPNATTIVEKPLFKNDGHERTNPDVSPDGKKLAFILDRTRLQVMDLDSKKVTELTDGSTHRTRSGGFTYMWSPDSRWIALEIIDRMHDPYSDIAIINVDTKELTNITNSGYFDQSPRWALDGNAITFESERYGMRNHASWGSMSDAMIVFLNQDAYDRFNLSTEDYELRKDLDKKNKKKDDKKGDAKDEKKTDEVTPINVELDGLSDRIVRLTPQSTNYIDGILTPDGETLYYMARMGNGPQLWKLKLRDGDHKMVSKVDGARMFALSGDGKTMFIAGATPRKLDPKSDKLTPITYSSTMRLDHAAEREYMFDNMAREVAQRFYRTDMHGVDWDAMTKTYRRFLPHINNNYDYAEMLSELLGELNVSHTGGRYSHPASANADRTATLGLLYDLKYTGDGVKVAEVIEKGPFNRADSKMRSGAIILKINGQDVTPDNDLTALLLDQRGKKTLVTFRDANGDNIEEVVLPISSATENTLLYDRWVKQRAADVDRMSNGRLGYVHIQSMGDDSFRSIYSDILGKYNDREGIVIDIRWNGGGRLHEDIEVLFSGQKYFTQEIRGDKTCVMPSRRWTKPSIMLMSEACYSNAHGTPWVYKHQGLGQLVGMPVPGTMTSVNWVTMQDPTLVYGIPVVGYRLADGSFLENQQLEPDIRVSNDPALIVKGEDQQLKAAVEALLKQIDESKK